MNRGILKGFTLAELLVATLVLSIMLVVMAPVMTQKAKKRIEQKVEIVQSQPQETLPVGAIVLWYGPNVPEGWIECGGQMLSDSEFHELRNAIATDYIPDLNRVFSTVDTNLKWIMKSK